jgi:hypothetical protein
MRQGPPFRAFAWTAIWLAVSTAAVAFAAPGRSASALDPESAAQLGIPRASIQPSAPVDGGAAGEATSWTATIPLSTAALGDSDGAWFDTPPPRRSGHAAIYDPVRDRMLVFGGYNSAFTSGTIALSLEGDPVWSPLSLNSGAPPPLSEDYFATYDVLRDRLIVFGGRTYRGPLAYVWALNLSGPMHWSALTASGEQLEPRSQPAVAYDSRRNRLLVFGGRRDTSYVNEVWAFNLEGTPTWTRLDPTGTPPLGRVHAQAIYDPDGDRLVIFGGSVLTHPRVLEGTNETWVLDLTGEPAWSELNTAATAPPAGSPGVAVYDPIERRMLLVGHSSEQDAADLWCLSLADSLRWSKLSTTGQLPGRRAGHTAIYDSRRDRILVYGGQFAPLDAVGVDALALRPQPQWGRLSTVELPRGRFGHATVHDLKRDRLIVFGGVASSGQFGEGDYTNEAWSISLGDLKDVQRVEPSGDPPPPRHEPAGVYDPVGDRAIFFGGWTYEDNYFDDTWVLSLQDGPAWQRIHPQGDAPPGRRAHAALYDPIRHRMLMWGGSDRTGALGDLWALWLDPPMRWERLEPAGPAPRARFFASFTYDPVRDRAILFGGRWGSTSTDEIWSLEMSDSLRWVQLQPDGRLPALERHGAVYDAEHDELLVHGGWYLDYDMIIMGSWLFGITLDSHPRSRTLEPPPPWPGARAAHTCMFDPSRDRLVVWAGTDIGDSYNDSWRMQFDASASRPAWLLAVRSGLDGVRLDWCAARGPGTPVKLFRRQGGGDWALLGGSIADAAGQAHFDDRAALPGSEYHYRVSVLGPTGEEYSDEITVLVPGGSGILLLGARPNPASSLAPEIALWLPGAGEAKLDVFDIRGRRVWAAEVGDLGKGLHRVQAARLGGPGVYFARLTRGVEVRSARLVTLR